MAKGLTRKGYRGDDGARTGRCQRNLDMCKAWSGSRGRDRDWDWRSWWFGRVGVDNIHANGYSVNQSTRRRFFRCFLPVDKAVQTESGVQSERANDVAPNIVFTCK